MSEPGKLEPAVAHRQGRLPEGDPPGQVARIAPWFAFLGGAAAWALHLVIAYALVEVACRSDRLAGSLLGLDTAHALGLALTLVAAVTAFGAASVAWSMTKDGIPLDPVDQTGAPEAIGRRRFMAYAGVVMNGLFLLAIVMGGLPFLVLRACSGA